MSQYLNSESFLFFHKGIEIPVIVKFFYWKAEPTTFYYPGVPEEIEVVSVIIPNKFEYVTGNEDFLFSDLILEEFGEEINVSRFCAWVEGLEQSAVKAFHEHIKNKKENIGE